MSYGSEDLFKDVSETALLSQLWNEGEAIHYDIAPGTCSQARINQIQQPILGKKFNKASPTVQSNHMFHDLLPTPKQVIWLCFVDLYSEPELPRTFFFLPIQDLQAVAFLTQSFFPTCQVRVVRFHVNSRPPLLHLLGRNCQLPIAVFPPDLNGRLPTAVFRTGPHPRAQDGSVPVCQIECPNLCQIECQNLCQIECQSLCPIEVRNLCQIECQNLCQIECPNLQIECQNLCPIECLCQIPGPIEVQNLSQIECQNLCQLECQNIVSPQHVHQSGPE